MLINGKEADIGAVLPLRVKHWRELEKIGIGTAELRAPSVDIAARFAAYVAHLANPDITESDIDALEMSDMNAVMNAISTARAEINRPT